MADISQLQRAKNKEQMDATSAISTMQICLLAKMHELTIFHNNGNAKF